MIRQIIQSIRLYLNRKGEFYGLSISQLGFVPGNKSLYRLALLHKSASQVAANGVVLNYERLEFLGDAVLELVTSEYLFRTNGSVPEGEMTKMRASIVCD